MSALRCLFVVQGEGRGHLTQALALRSILEEAGHDVCRVVVTRGGSDAIPAFFVDQIGAPITYADGFRFVVKDSSRSISWTQTVAYNFRRLPRLKASLTSIAKLVRQLEPDVILNFYEPLGGLYALWYRPSVPVVAIAHQFMFLHPQYVFPQGFYFQRKGTAFFTRISGLGAARHLGLSLRELPNQGRVRVVPPLLRNELFDLPAEQSQPFLLLYLYHHSCMDAIVRWHEQRPDVELHCFWNNPDAPDTWQYDETLTFHPLHGQKFLEMMARCQGLVTTSGFETMAEAMYLGKPLMLIPMQKHFEQHCNGVDGVAEGAAIHAADFHLDKLLDFVPQYKYDTRSFRGWVHRAGEIFLREIEAARAEYKAS